jgi:hypothetical protein
MKLRTIAFARSGDKGDVSNVCVFVYDEADYLFLLKTVTEEAVAELYGELVRGTVTRYELPALHGLNFVLTRALGGGVSHSLRTDPHGKAYGSLMLTLDVPDGAPSTLAASARG